MNCAKTRELFQWKPEHDKVFLREVITEEPYNTRSGSKERGAVWTRISDHLNSLTSYNFRVTQRSVRERFDKLMKEFHMKEKDESTASGIDVEFDEITQALTDIKERIEEAEEKFGLEKEKQQKEKSAAEEMRVRATERLKETKKRSSIVGNDESSPSKRRLSGIDMTTLMNNSLELKKKEHEALVEIKKRELELQSQNQQQFIDVQRQILQQQQQSQQQQQAINLAMLQAVGELVKSFSQK